MEENYREGKPSPEMVERNEHDCLMDITPVSTPTPVEPVPVNRRKSSDDLPTKQPFIRKSMSYAETSSRALVYDVAHAAEYHRSINLAFSKKRLGKGLFPATFDVDQLPPFDYSGVSARNKVGARFGFPKSFSGGLPSNKHEPVTWLPTESGIHIRDYLTYPTFLRWGIIDHRSHFFYCWNISSLITNLLNAIVIPLWVGFYYKGDRYVTREYFFFVYIVISTIQMFLDVIIRCSLTYYAPGGSIVSKRRVILHTYFKSWFIVDAIAGFPYQIFLINNGPPTYGYFELLRLVKFLRILTTDVGFTSAVLCAFMLKHGLSFSLTQLALLKSFLLMVIVIHIIACGAYIVANYTGLDGPWESPVITHNEHDYKYSEAFYWATMTATTTGYGDITVVASQMQVYGIFAMLLGAVMWSTIIALMANILRESSIERGAAERKFRGLSKFVSIIRGDKFVRHNLLIHLKRVTEYPSISLSSIHMMLSDLSPSMRASLLLRLHAFWLNSCSYFMAVDDPWYIWSLSNALTSVRYHPDEYLGVEGSKIRRITIIHIGCCIAERRSCLLANCVVGEEMLLSKPPAYSDNYRVIILVEAWILDNISLKALVDKYPELKKTIKRRAVRLAFKRSIRSILYKMQVQKAGRASITLPMQTGRRFIDNMQLHNSNSTFD